MKSQRPKRKILLVSRLFLVGAILTGGVGIFIAWRQHQANGAVEQAVRQEVQAGNSNAPNTAQPSKSEFDKHQVPREDPRYLFIPKLSVKAMVKPLGPTASNQIQSPRNVFDVGWYNKSARPGQPGAVVVDGHVSSWTTRGVFYGIKDLRPGELVTIERGDGITINYKIVTIQTYEADKVDMKTALEPVAAGKPGLNLITCDGDVVKGTNGFDKRVVVFAEQI